MKYHDQFTSVINLCNLNQLDFIFDSPKSINNWVQILNNFKYPYPRNQIGNWLAIFIKHR